MEETNDIDVAGSLEVLRDEAAKRDAMPAYILDAVNRSADLSAATLEGVDELIDLTRKESAVRQKSDAKSSRNDIAILTITFLSLVISIAAFVKSFF